MSETPASTVPNPTRGDRGGGRGERGGGRGSNDDHTISKALSYTLRHGAAKEKLKLRSDGYANVADLLAMPKFKKFNLTFEKLQQIVRDNDKQRYAMVLASSAPEQPIEGPSTTSSGDLPTDMAGVSITDAAATKSSAPASADPASTDPKEYLIRATQGHSIPLSSTSLLTSLDPKSLPTAIHGTFYSSFSPIVASGHLSRMGRNHIHLATAETGVVSGMRKDAEVLIYVDVLRAAEEGGLKFWVSDNGVVLTEGDSEGKLDLKWVAKMTNRDGGVLWEGGKVVGEVPEGAGRGRGRGRGGRGGRGGRWGRGGGKGGRGGRGRGGGDTPADRVDAGDP